jgi:hypothetical protein
LEGAVNPRKINHPELMAIWAAAPVQYIDNAETDDDGAPIGQDAESVRAAQAAHDKLEAFMVPLLERGGCASADLWGTL